MRQCLTGKAAWALCARARGYGCNHRDQECHPAVTRSDLTAVPIKREQSDGGSDRKHIPSAGAAVGRLPVEAGRRALRRRDGDLGEAGRPHAARGRALPHRAGRAIGGPGCARLRSDTFGPWRRSRLGRPRVVRRHRDRPDHDERCNAGSRLSHGADFWGRPRLGRFRGHRSARTCGRDRLVQLRRHDRTDARWRLRIVDRPLRARARQSARGGSGSGGRAHRHREPQRRTGTVLGIARRRRQFWRGDGDAAPHALSAERSLRRAAIPVCRSESRSRRLYRYHGWRARRADSPTRRWSAAPMGLRWPWLCRPGAACPSKARRAWRRSSGLVRWSSVR